MGVHNGKHKAAIAEARRLLAGRRLMLRAAKWCELIGASDSLGRLYRDADAVKAEARAVLRAAGLPASKPWRTVARRGR